MSFQRRPPTHEEVRKRIRQWKRIEPYILFGTTLIAVLIIGGFLAREQGAQLSKADKFVTINGENLSREEFNNTLSAQAGSAVLDQLIIDKLVAQAAAEKGISVDSEDIEVPAKLQPSPDKDQIKKRLVQNALLRQLILVEVTDSEVRHVYETFKDELTRYDISIREVGSENERTVLNLSLHQLEEEFGIATAYDIINLAPGTEIESLALANIRVTVRLLESRSDFELLRTEAEDILVNARSTEYLCSLIENARIDGPVD